VDRLTATPMLSVTLAYNHTFGYFSFKNQFTNVELVNGVLWADSDNTGELEWDVRSFGVNAVVSQAYGKWTPFAGAGYNWMMGSVRGRLTSVWRTPLIAPSVGEASSRPPKVNTRVILGFMRDGRVFKFFTNGEVKANGKTAGRAFIISMGLAAPFKIGASASVVRQGRNRSGAAALPSKQRRPRKAKILDVRPAEDKPSRKERRKRKTKGKPSPELIFIQ